MTGMDADRAAVDRTIGAWLAGGDGGVAPDELLARAMAEVVRTPQRRAWLARLGGAPSSTRRGRNGYLVPAWLAIALVVVTAIVTAGLSGAFRPPEPRPAILVPTVVGSPTASVPVTVNRSPSPPPTPSPSPPVPSSSVPLLPVVQVFRDLGFKALPLDAVDPEVVGSTVTFVGRTALGPGLAGTITSRIVVNVGAVSDGVAIDLGGTAPQLIKGDTAAALAGALGRLPGVDVTRSDGTRLDGEPAIVIVVELQRTSRVAFEFARHGDRLFALQADVTVASGELADAMEGALLETFGGHFRFIDGTIAGPGFRLPIPDGWRRTDRRGRAEIAAFASGSLSGLPAVTFQAQWGGADEDISVSLGQDSGEATISGHDLTSLRASALAAFPRGTATPVRIDGVEVDLIRVTQGSYVGPLAGLAVTWHDGIAYVFSEHLLFDAPPGRVFPDLLSTLRFD